jgi:hypothetical protein
MPEGEDASTGVDADFAGGGVDVEFEGGGVDVDYTGGGVDVDYTGGVDVDFAPAESMVGPVVQSRVSPRPTSSPASSSRSGDKHSSGSSPLSSRRSTPRTGAPADAGMPPLPQQQHPAAAMPDEDASAGIDTIDIDAVVGPVASASAPFDPPPSKTRKLSSWPPPEGAPEFEEKPAAAFSSSLYRIRPPPKAKPPADEAL